MSELLTIDEFSKRVLDPAKMQLAIDMLLDENDRLRKENEDLRAALLPEIHDLECLRRAPDAVISSVKELALSMSPRYAEVIERRLNFETLKQVGDDLGISGNRVRDMQQKVLRKARRLHE